MKRASKQKSQKAVPAESAVDEASAREASDGAASDEVAPVVAASVEAVAASEAPAELELAAPRGAPVEDIAPDALAADEAGDGETREGTGVEANGVEPEGVDAARAGDEAPSVDSTRRLESIVESLLFAADRALAVSDLKRLVGERDAKKLSAAIDAVRARHADSGIQLVGVAGGFQFRTATENAPWVSKLVAGRPQRLSRAMLETLAIVAYRQPVTRPEIDEIRGVDCGPVLKTLLERELVRVLGKKEEVGRPMLYGTTPEFLKTFSLRDLSELPTLREFLELSEQQRAIVDAQAPLPLGEAPEAARATDSVPPGARSPFAPMPMDLSPVDEDEEDELLGELDNATLAATRASGPPPGAEASASASAEPDA